MPWIIRKTGPDDKPWCVFKEGADGEPEGAARGCHATEDEAKRQRSALYVHADGAKADLVFAFGGAVKAVGNQVEGLLVPYGAPDDLDADGEYFTDRTDLGLRLPAAVKLFYHHGQNPRLGRTPIAWAELERREDGVWFKSDFSEDLEWEDDERAKALKYRAHALKLVREGLMGASSGAAAHVVVRQAAGKGTRITRWPLAEASITPTPANARTSGTVSLKALCELPDPLEAESAEECGECKARSLAADADSLISTAKALVGSYDRLAAKDGRILSASRRGKLLEVIEALQALHADTEPRPRDAAAPKQTEPAMGAAVSTADDEDGEDAQRLIADAFSLVAAQPEWVPPLATIPGGRDAGNYVAG